MASGVPDGNFLLNALMSKKDVSVKKSTNGDYVVASSGVEVTVHRYLDERSVEPCITHIKVGLNGGDTLIDVAKSWPGTFESWLKTRRDERGSSLYVDALAALNGKGQGYQSNWIEKSANKNANQ